MAGIDREVLVRLPKAELHCHLDGSIRPATLLELGKEYGKPMPASDPASLAEIMVVKNARNLEDYLSRFTVTLSVLQHAQPLERIAYELVADAAQDGIRYIEIRFAPVLNTLEGLSLGEAVEAPLRGIERAERDTGTRGRLIVCALRDMAPDLSLELARLAIAYRQRGVVGFDLAGGESGNSALLHAEAFAHARRHDMALTVHAGEGDGAGSVRQAVHDCLADRIGHATRLIEDVSLTEYVNDRRIPLEICLTSNVQTRVAKTYAEHPLRKYFDRGLKVVLNTDNRLMSGTTLTDEYAHAAAHLGFSFDELCTVALYGFESAFLPWDERRAMVDSARAEINQLRSAT
ncbi:MAG: adenosine deaminase [Gemmatimonadaceae bacterium]